MRSFFVTLLIAIAIFTITTSAIAAPPGYDEFGGIVMPEQAKTNVPDYTRPGNNPMDVPGLR